MPNIVLKRSDKSIKLVRTSPNFTMRRSGFGPAGLNGTDADKTYALAFINTAQVTVNHNLNKIPSVTVIDTTGDQVEGDVDHVTTNQLVATFSSSFSGIIICN